MTSPTRTPQPPESSPIGDVAGPATPRGTADNPVRPIDRMLTEIDDAAIPSGNASAERESLHAQNQQRLVERRLGMASGLFTALRCKHPASAAHSFRVALRCSCWAAAMRMPEKLRIQLEAAALMHDIGKIGVPDDVLLKQGRLTDREFRFIDQSREHAGQVLRAAGMPKGVVDSVVACGAWHDGTHRSLKLKGDQTPFIARMIAIVDAYDSMTTDQVYRPARSRERAIATLFEGAGSQFDPELVTSFSDLLERDQCEFEQEVVKRWLGTASAPLESMHWEDRADAVPASPRSVTREPFYTHLIDQMHDAVVFVDPQRRIKFWNHGAERMTGIGETAALGSEYSPSLIGMRRTSGEDVSDQECHVAQALLSGAQEMERVKLVGQNGRICFVQLQVLPVRDSEDALLGATILLRDISSEASLEERCQELRYEMTRDPMTQVANRAEFDRMLEAFVEAHQEIGVPCSLIMADIDRFKSINDTFGHQAGDEAIMSFASLLKSMCRSGDLVARYGGEEFAILCADCSNAVAARRADEVRRKLAGVKHECIGNSRFTASFGVTELQPGDTAETMLRRADRGLLMAKDQGRNRVVQLGDGMSTASQTGSGWLSFRGLFGSLTGQPVMIETQMVTNVPVELAVQKLRGFIADHEARILKTSENHLSLEVSDRSGSKKRRTEDRPIQFQIDLRLSQEHVEQANASGMASGKYVYTYIDTKIQPRRERSVPRGKQLDRARMMLGSLKSYLMAKEIDD